MTPVVGGDHRPDIVRVGRGDRGGPSQGLRGEVSSGHDRIDQSPGIRGRPAGAFCSGVDIDWLTATPPERIVEQGVSFYDLPQSMVRALIALPVPTLAAVDGPAAIQLSLFAEGRYRDALAAAIAPPAFRRPSK